MGQHGLTWPHVTTHYKADKAWQITDLMQCLSEDFGGLNFEGIIQVDDK